MVETSFRIPSESTDAFYLFLLHFRLWWQRRDSNPRHTGVPKIQALKVTKSVKPHFSGQRLGAILSNLDMGAAQRMGAPLRVTCNLCRCSRMESLSAAGHSINPLSGERCERYAISGARVFGKHRDGPQRYIAHQADLGHVPAFDKRLDDDHQLTPA